MRITDDELNPTKVEVNRLTKRYNLLQDWYSEEVASIKRRSPLSIINDLNSRDLMHWELRNLEDYSRERTDGDFKWGWDVPLLMLKLMANWDYAVAHKNIYLLRDSIHGFPVMNYLLKEGPFRVSSEAVFGPEDFHVILKIPGSNDLAYFVPDLLGLKTGTLVENLI